MATVRPFAALRPKKEYVTDVISLPYDVMNRAEAKEMAEGNPKSFLHITRAEIDLPDSVSAYDSKVYDKGKENLEKFKREGILQQESKPSFYIYRQTMGDIIQTGLVATVAVEEYENNIIKKHELTRIEKEEDRIKHFDVCNANTEPIFLTYIDDRRIDLLIEGWLTAHKPEYDFLSDDGIRHELWVIDDMNLIKSIENLFKDVPSLYIADGHHRSASAYKVGKRKDSEESQYFMAVLFPASNLAVFDYNRVVKDLNGLTQDEFMQAVKDKFDLEKSDETPYKPKCKHEFGMYIDGEWYRLKVKNENIDESDIVSSLDVELLQNLLLKPTLGIQDPRKDARIDFVGGIRGLKELEKRVSRDMTVAFSVFPVTVEDLIIVSDEGKIMPPKSTWFEPKLGSGLFIHEL